MLLPPEVRIESFYEMQRPLAIFLKLRFVLFRRAKTDGEPTCYQRPIEWLQQHGEIHDAVPRLCDFTKMFGTGQKRQHLFCNSQYGIPLQRRDRCYSKRTRLKSLMERIYPKRVEKRTSVVICSVVRQPPSLVKLAGVSRDRH